MTWEMVIGLETHVELSTKTKIFCACTTQFGGAPNTQCCPVCTGMPGTLPMMNESVVECAVKAGMALGCNIARYFMFDRKNYFYPDLPKAYQISQLYLPIARDGAMSIGGKIIRIHELHMEEDAGKLIHDPALGQTRADYNRCGVPLIEIVTEPDFRTAEEVISYLEKLKSMLQYLGVSDCKMQEGSLRCDVNLSIRPIGTEALGTRTEMKNLNSFRAISQAIAYEFRRQVACLEAGGAVSLETRRWDEDREVTCAMRAKENARDYRYFPEPDIPPIVLSEEYLIRIQGTLPELAEEKMARYQQVYGLSVYDTEMLTGQRALAEFFEGTVSRGAPPKEAANWMMGQVLRQLSACGMEPGGLVFTPQNLARLIALVVNGTINRNTAVEVFDAVFAQDDDVEQYVSARGLAQIGDVALVAETVKKVLAANPKSIEDLRGGKERALGFLVGQTMRALCGKGDPKLVNQLVRAELGQEHSC